MNATQARLSPPSVRVKKRLGRVGIHARLMHASIAHDRAPLVPRRPENHHAVFNDNGGAAQVDGSCVAEEARLLRICSLQASKMMRRSEKETHETARLARFELATPGFVGEEAGCLAIRAETKC